MEVDRKRSSEGAVPDAKRPSVDASGPLSAEEIEQFQKEAIFRQMMAYKRERDELLSQLSASHNGDEALRSELAKLTEKYVAASKQVERLQSPTLARVSNSVKTEDSSSGSNQSSKGSPSAGNQSEGVTAPQSTEKSDTTLSLELKASLAAANGEITKLKEFLSTEDRKRQELEQRIAQLEQELAAAPTNALNMEMRLQEAHAEAQRLVAETSNLHHQIADMKTKQAEYEHQIRDRSMQETAALERKIAAAESDVARIRSARDELLSEVNVLKAECAEHRNEATRYKELAELSDVATNSKGNTESAAQVEQSAPAGDQTEFKDLAPDALRDRCLALSRQNKALTEEISGLEQGFARATARAKAALKATTVAEQKLGVLNTAKIRSDEKFIGAMRARDQLNQELSRAKQSLSKTAEILSDQKAVELKLTAQIAKLQKQLMQTELDTRQSRTETDSIRRAKHESDSILASARAVQEKLREQLAQRDAEKNAILIGKRSAETAVEKLNQQLDTQRAVSGMGSANEVQEQLESLRSIAMCPVCQKNWKDRALTTCGHTLCADCVQSRLAARMRKCPMCNGHFASNDVLAIHL